MIRTKKELKKFDRFASLAMKCGYTIDDAIVFWGITAIISDHITDKEIDDLFDEGIMGKISMKLNKKS